MVYMLEGNSWDNGAGTEVCLNNALHRPAKYPSAEVIAIATLIR